MPIECRQIYRRPSQPDVRFGEFIDGIQRERNGKWVAIHAQVIRVELAETEPNGGRTFAVNLWWANPSEWRRLLRRTGQPDINVGDMIRGLALDGAGKWEGVLSPVEAVELVSTKPNGSRVFRVRFGPSVPNPKS
jgi:hypothetical protein